MRSAKEFEKYNDNLNYDPKPVELWADLKNNRIFSITFWDPSAVFGNVSNISDDQFAQELLQAYNITEATHNNRIYQHVNDAGWCLEISGKIVPLKAVPPQASRKFD